jgi:hypothetical protein
MNKISNLKIYKKFLSLVSAIVMITTPFSALAEGNKDNSTNTIPVSDEYDEEYDQFTYDEYIANIENEAIPAMEKFGKTNDSVYSSIYMAYYYGNYRNCRKIRQELIDNGDLYENLEDGEFEVNILITELSLKNIKELKKTTNLDDLFDISLLIHDPKTRDLAHKAFVNLVKTYEKGTLDCDEYREVTDQLSKLKFEDYFISYGYLYNLTSELYEHCIINGFPQKEVKEYLTLNGSSIKDVNKKKAKGFVDLAQMLLDKDERTELEEYILLYLINPPYTKMNGENQEALSRIEEDYITNLDAIK